jgi:hypothetical protein
MRRLPPLTTPMMLVRLSASDGQHTFTDTVTDTFKVLMDWEEEKGTIPYKFLSFYFRDPGLDPDISGWGLGGNIWL